jgi:hypothetical protein
VEINKRAAWITAAFMTTMGGVGVGCVTSDTFADVAAVMGIGVLVLFFFGIMTLFVYWMVVDLL